MEEIFNMNETQTENVKSDQKPTRNRNVLANYISSSARIQSIISPNINGDMSFLVSVKDVGFSKDDFKNITKKYFQILWLISWANF